MNKKWTALLALLLAAVIAFSGCAVVPPVEGDDGSKTTVSTTTTSASKDGGSTTLGPQDDDPNREQSTTLSGQSGSTTIGGQGGQPSGSTASSTTKTTTSTTKKPVVGDGQYPEFDGETPYITLASEPSFTAAEKSRTTSFERYSELDSLGRAGVAYACVGKDLMPTGERGSLSYKPSGWWQATYDVVPGGYLYNRSHLIGWQLTGENDNEKDLITGTKLLNNYAMLPFENMVADYIKETGNHVLYRVTPIYEGNDLVAKWVRMEAWSVEDDGDGICFDVLCFNAQPGITIDYATGRSSLTAGGVTTTTVAGTVYILNISSKKIHLESCSRLPAEKNRAESTKSIAELEDEGYSRCQICLKG
ncbi:MAG: DNA/RNA non-specific endonuclease [Clostridia bacterium]|nr:DNA/RNA non-specific endonuclease [Clostridia bacterium]